ncbi:Annexin [Popillia japonica]|uniref:Annexin n=1 Tax=Popillia japonica TaxID=7064 RepID=A0AAW1LUQ4_POPJA
MHKAISGLGTDEPTIVEILGVHTNEEIIAIRDEYEGHNAIMRYVLQKRTEYVRNNIIILLITSIIMSCNPCDAETNITGKIIGGYNASIEDYPSYAAIFNIRYGRPYAAIFNIRYGRHQLICGGIYIHKLWILTAEHCLTDVQVDKPRLVEDVLVKMGLKWLFDSGQSRKAVEFVRHPRGHCEFLKKSCDIGLIRLEKQFEFDRYVRLATIIDEYPFSKKVVVVGYGTNSASSFVAHRFLQCVNLTILSITRDTIYCRDTTPRGSCYGDSGGPMYESASGKLVGIISSGVCRDGIGIYVNVYVYRSWISKVLQMNRSSYVEPSILSLFICIYLIFYSDYSIK